MSSPSDLPSTSSADGQVFNLEAHKANKFLDDLARYPFACVVRTGDGELKIVTKDIPQDEMARLVDALTVLEEGD